MEAQRDPTTWRDGLETTHLEGILLGKLRMQSSARDKVWGVDSWLEKWKTISKEPALEPKGRRYQTKAIVKREILNKPPDKNLANHPVLF